MACGSRSKASFDWSDAKGQLVSRTTKEGPSPKSCIVFVQQQTAGCIYSAKEVKRMAQVSSLRYVSGLTRLTGSAMYLIDVLPKILEDFKLRHPVGRKDRISSSERALLQTHIKTILQEECNRLLQAAAARLQQLDSKLQSVSKYLANASMSVEAKQTLAEQTRQIHTEIEEIHHTIAEFGDTSGVIVRLQAVPEAGGCFPMMVVQLGDVHIFSCPSQLERVVGMQVTAEQAQEAAQSIDIYNSKEARWYAATMSKQMQCVMSLLGDEVVSNSIYAGYLIRPMVGQHTPAVTLCYQAGVLDPGMRVFKRPPTARFGYVQEVPYEPEVAITVKDYKEVIQPAGQCYLQQPISQWRKCKDKEAAESREDTGGLDQGVYLDCSRVSLPSDSSSGLAVAAIVESSGKYWVKKDTHGLKLKEAGFKNCCSYEITASLASKYLEEDVGLDPDQVTWEQEWHAAGTAVAYAVKSCGYEEAYWKIMQNPMLGGRPNRGDYADAIQQLLDERVTCFPSDRVHSKASQLAAMPHTGITIEVAGLDVHSGQPARIRTQLTAPPARPSSPHRSSKAVVTSCSKAEGRVSTQGAVAPVAAAAVDSRDQLEEPTPTVAQGASYVFEYACSNLVEAVLDADSGSVMAMRKAAQAARTKVQLRHSCGPHMLPCPASGLQLAVQQQLDIIQLEECDLRIANPRLLEIIVQELEVLYGILD